MTADIQFKRGSTLPVYLVTLNRPDTPDIPLPLAGATVRLIARTRPNGPAVVDQELTIIDPAQGICEFTRDSDDFIKWATCRAEIIVTFGNGDIMILPPTGYYRLIVEDSLLDRPEAV
jgi:hypothetical protein